MLNKDIVDYYSATLNEIAIDKHLYRLSGKKYDKQNILVPRPSVRLSGIKRILLIIPQVSPLISLFLLSIFKFFKYLTLLNFKSNKNNNKISSPLKLAFSQRAIDLINNETNKGSWIVFPWVNYESNYLDNCTNIMDVLSFIDLVNALSLSFKSHLLFYKKRKKWILQTYTCFEWFLANSFLKRSSGEIIIAEHYDRWAVLSDINCYRNSDLKKITLFQHGLVNVLSNSKINLFYRLKSVEIIYCFDYESYDFFQNFIFHPLSKVEKRILLPKLNLSTPEQNQNKENILIVGNNISLAYHQNLVNAIMMRHPSKYYIFYKPHPNDKLTKEYDNPNWLVIQDRNFYPKVDVCISYPSTLGYEYQLNGIRTIFHDINEDMTNIKKVLNDLNIK